MKKFSNELKETAKNALLEMIKDDTIIYVVCISANNCSYKVKAFIVENNKPIRITHYIAHLKDIKPDCEMNVRIGKASNPGCDFAYMVQYAINLEFTPKYYNL